MRVDLFDFDLPRDRIATEPARPRDSARLLHIGKNELKDRFVSDLASLLNPGDLLVTNDTRVIPARLFGRRGTEGGKVEVTLHKELAPCRWASFARPAKRCKPGDRIDFGSGLEALVVERDGPVVVLDFLVAPDLFFPLLDRVGVMPLPPYIKRDSGENSEQSQDDKQDYQTIFAEKPGAVAAPTASLHFTENLLTALKERGIQTTRLTLHVGAGTFLPVVVDDTDDHSMHSEYCIMPEETADLINETHDRGNQVIAAGTTSLRTIESFAREDGKVIPGTKDTSIFITPGYQFRAVDRLLTNFHLPRSTLFMLVSAFSGIETMQNAYHHAIDNGYRFYSYGDASLLDRNDCTEANSPEEHQS
jgi:S-adenosylmethionine:tRNA ribosyltransferase-isomerase